MRNIVFVLNKTVKLNFFIFALMIMASASIARADENDARNILKAMSDYMGKQKSISFQLDSSLDVISVEQQRFSIASSSVVRVDRPNNISISRKGGFAETDLMFNGKTLWIYRKDKKMYAKADIPGDLENLIDTISTKLQKPLPGADLLLANFFDGVMPLVTNVKDLGSGYIRGQECDHLAFRTDEIDWQIWIAHGNRPYPLRLSITSAKIPGSPQYQLDVIEFKSGKQVAAADFNFKPPAGVKEVDATELKDFDELPEIYKPQN